MFAFNAHGAAHQVESRMFCPALGIAEDPVSGNAHGLLGVYLAHLGLLAPADGRVQFSGVQGHYLHRPGRVEVELEFRDGRLEGVWIRGQAVSIFRTQMTL
jgi:PhzF family phenazine biosynthesis protein